MVKRLPQNVVNHDQLTLGNLKQEVVTQFLPSKIKNMRIMKKRMKTTLENNDVDY